jgi:hypothetical protein
MVAAFGPPGTPLNTRAFSSSAARTGATWTSAQPKKASATTQKNLEFLIGDVGDASS